MKTLLLALAFSTLAAPLIVGCSGTCSETRDDFTAAARRMSRVAGTGISFVSGGEYHLGLTLSPGMLQRLLSRQGESSRPGQEELEAPIHARISVGGSESERRTAVILDVWPTVEEIELLDAETHAIRLHFGIQANVAVRSPGRAAEHIVPGTYAVNGFLQLQHEVGQPPQLVAVLREVSAEHFSIGLHALGAAETERVREFIVPALSRYLLSEVRTIPIVQFPNVPTGSVVITLSPIELQTFPETGTVFIGLLTNLRPSPGGGVGPDPDLTNGALSVSIHPGLAAAAIRLALAEGTLPSGFDGTLHHDSDGEIRVLLEQLGLESERFHLSFRVWDLRRGHCTIDTVDTSGPIRMREDSIALVPTDVSTTAVDDAITEGHWLHSEFAVKATDLGERLLDVRGITLGSGEWLPLVPAGFDVDEWRVRVTMEPMSQ